MDGDKSIQFSLIVPVYKNEANIDDVIEAINASIASQVRSKFEVIFVIDGSPDRSRDLLFALLQRQEWPSQLIALSRNFGAFSAIRTGLTFATGKAIAVMATDLQDPANLVAMFWEILAEQGIDVVCGQRMARHDGLLTGLASAVFWWVYRKCIFAEAPAGGVSIFAFNSRVKESILSISAPNNSMFSQVMWVGFKRKFVPYMRQARKAGRSAYTFRRKLLYALDLPSFVFRSAYPFSNLAGTRRVDYFRSGGGRASCCVVRRVDRLDGLCVTRTHDCLRVFLPAPVAGDSGSLPVENL